MTSKIERAHIPSDYDQAIMEISTELDHLKEINAELLEVCKNMEWTLHEVFQRNNPHHAVNGFELNIAKILKIGDARDKMTTTISHAEEGMK